MCFNGKVQCSFVCEDRWTGKLKVTFYDREWNVMPFERHYPKNDVLCPKPENYDKMLQISERLAEGIPFVRIDLFEVDGKVYFGEMTFYPGSGMEEFTPREWDVKLGEMLKLPE